MGINTATSVENRGIMSPNYLRAHNIRALKSHVNTTGGGDLISLAIGDSPSYERYIKPGIAFEVDIIPDAGNNNESHPINNNKIGKTNKTSKIITKVPITQTIRSYEHNRRGALEGEVYARDFIPVSSIKSIVINPILAATKLKDIDLCDIGYGSASVEDRILYALGPNYDSSSARAIVNQYHTYQSEIQNEIDELLQLQRTVPRAQKTIIRNQILEKHEKLHELDKALGMFCSNAIIEEIRSEFGHDISQLTLGEFIQRVIDNDFVSGFRQPQ